MLGRMVCRRTIVVLGGWFAVACRFDPHGGGQDLSADDATESEDTSDSADTGDTADTTDTADTDDEGDSSDDSTDTPPCGSDGDCSGAMPYCEAGKCVDCNGFIDETCADRDPARPACDVADGVCVACTMTDDALCQGLTPVCGPGNTCVGCTRHDQCMVACDLETGGCMPEDVRYVVDRGGCTAGDEDGSESRPFCTIAAAVAAVPASAAGTLFVNGGSGTYLETVTINGNRTVALRGRNAPVIAMAGDNVMQTRTGTRVYLQEVQLGGYGAQFGIDCQLGIVWLDEVVVASNNNNGINAADCSIHLRDSTVQANGSHGVRSTGGTLDVKRSRIGENTGIGLTVHGTAVSLDEVEIVANGIGGVVIDGGAHLLMRTGTIARNGDDFLASRGVDAVDGTFELLYVTVAANDGSGGDKSIACEAGGSGTVRNSIVVAEEVDSVQCPSLLVEDSAVQDPDIVVGNTNVGPWRTEWFSDVAGVDFHLGSAQADFAAIARWQAGDPAADSDGDPRPINDGAEDWPGADIPR